MKERFLAHPTEIFNYSFKSGFADQHLKVRTVPQPGIISAACGISYNMFVEPKHVGLRDDPFRVGKQNNTIDTWMELITPTTAEVLAYYDHPHWGKYAAITENRYGKGTATYIGCLTSAAIMRGVLEHAVKEAGLWSADQELAFPLITKSGINEQGQAVHYYFNYTDHPSSIRYPYPEGRELLTDTPVQSGLAQPIAAWGVMIIVEQ
jgi:beta-galactosidase